MRSDYEIKLEMILVGVVRRISERMSSRWLEDGLGGTA